jgi:putative DNA primase/helicase
VTVPPAQQCSLPGCEQEAVDASHPGALCESHLEATEADDPVTELEESQDGNDCQESETGNPARPAVEFGVFPADLVNVNQWHTWKATDDGRKVPRAPYETGDDSFVSAQDPDVRTDFETAREWVDKLPGHRLAFNIRDREEHPDEEYVLIDYDDARDPETDEMHPIVHEHIERAESYADVSTSGTGVHIFCRGALPDGVKAIDDTLPAADGFPDAEIEVYDSARFSAMTGDHIASSPASTSKCHAFLDDLAEEFATTAEGTPDELTREPEKTAAEIADVETTSDIQDVLDAIQHTDPSDIRLRSTVTHERADGSKSLDPSWAPSESGTRLAQVDDGWVYRKGMHGLNALQVVALEERIISRPDEYPSGEDFWRAVDALRERGTHIPEYEPPTGDESLDVVVECEPPADDPEPADVDAIRERIRGPIYDKFTNRDDGPTVLAHDPGAGKTTTAHLGADDRNRGVAFLFDKHRKAHQHRHDDVVPDVDLHLRGAAQPRDDSCARAQYDHGVCDEHGGPSNCPRMCPIYDRSKHYTGLVGALFREAREKELKQIIHRIRPLLADKMKHAYLLTNVPTNLPVDEICTLEELAEPAAAMLPVADGALELAETLADVADGEAPDGFRATGLVKRDGGGGLRFHIQQVHRLARLTGQEVSERTARRWIDDLQDLGLIDAGDYLSRDGVAYSTDGATLTRALSVLTSNADVEVAVKRRLAALAQELDSAAAWLRRARELVDLRADPEAARTRLNGGDRPPDDPG